MYGAWSQGAEFSRRTTKVLRRAISEAFLVPFRHLPRVIFHGVILACIIAGFWLLDSLKDPVLSSIVGIEYQPIAKLLSVVTTLFITCIYDFLTSILSKPNLFHVVSALFGICMMVISALLSDPVHGLSNRADKGPHRLLGWFAYFSIEVYGSLMVALFWSFTNSIMDLEQAKGAYGLIISIAQIGAIAGSTFATQSKTIGIPLLFLMSSMTIFSVSLMIKLYYIQYRDHPTMQDDARRRRQTIRDDRSRADSDVSESSISNNQNTDSASLCVAAAIMSEHGMIPIESSADEPSSLATTSAAGRGDNADSLGVFGIFGGFYEGLSLIMQHNYVMLLLGVSCLYEVVVTVLDYQFKILGADSVALHSDSIQDGGAGDGDRFANLLGHFGQVTNFLSFVVSFFGFSFLVRYIGVRSSLMIFPVVLFLAVLLTNLVPSLSVLFFSVSLIKALVFSLHDPVKELLYIPTSQPIKFKAKAWIDVFGSRLAKAGGSFITSIAAGKAERLRNIAEIPCLLLSLCILAIAWSIGTMFQKLVEERVVVGGDNTVRISKVAATRSREEWGSRSGSYDYQDCPEINGLKPGDVGYSGYDLQLFDGVWPDEDKDGKVVRVSSESNSTERRLTFI